MAREIPREPCKEYTRRLVSCGMDHARRNDLARLRPQLLGFAMRRLRNRELAEDAVQETLVAAMEGMSRFAGESSLNTWLTGILKHKIVDCMRASQREEPWDANEDETPAHRGDPEEHYSRRRFFEALEGSLKRLPEKAAHVFVAREVLGMDTVEICRQLAISSSHCWVLLHRAKARLRLCPDIQSAI